jgi:tRNA-guanine family transglycosylase
MLMTAHNLRFMQRLMEAARDAIRANNFETFAAKTINAFRSAAIDAPEADA